MRFQRFSSISILGTNQEDKQSFYKSVDIKVFFPPEPGLGQELLPYLIPTVAGLWLRAIVQDFLVTLR